MINSPQKEFSSRLISLNKLYIKLFPFPAVQINLCLFQKLLTMNSIRSNTLSLEPNTKTIFLGNSKKPINNTGKRSANLYYWKTTRYKKTSLKIWMKFKKSINSITNMLMIFIKDIMKRNIKNSNNQNKKLLNWESKSENFTKNNNREKSYLSNIKLKSQLVTKMPCKKSKKSKWKIKNFLKEQNSNLISHSSETVLKRKINCLN